MGFIMKTINNTCISIICLLVIVTFTSCATRYVPVEKVKTEYKYIDKLQHDSVYIKDSIRYYIHGDTVFADKYYYLYKYLFINKTDSFIKTDTINIPYPVERKLTKWEQIKMDFGGIALGGAIIIILIVVVQSVYTLKKGG